MSLNELLKPAEQLAQNGFIVDATYAQQTNDNKTRFATFPETARVFLPGGAAPAVGSDLPQSGHGPGVPDAARGRRRRVVQGRDGRCAVDAARRPRTVGGASVYPGQLTSIDLRRYRALTPAATSTEYRGLDIYGMPVPSSGGIAVGESLNLIEAYDRKTGQGLSDVDQVQYLHRFAEATATAFADRNRWIGDVTRVPTRELLSQEFADERACQLFDPAKAATRPIPFGDPDRRYDDCTLPGGAGQRTPEEHGTTNLTVADKWGNVAEYTLTIEATGGSGITVPGYGFLLNNELTDFNFVPLTAGVPDPNLPGPGKRPRSSMSPTIVLDDGRPVLAVGSPGGATIITTVTQVLLGTLDRKLPLVDAIAAPRLSSRNGDLQSGRTGDLRRPGRRRAHRARPHPDLDTGDRRRDGHPPAAGRHVRGRGRDHRRGGGSAMVVSPG